MQAQLGASASSPVLAEVTHCHCWSVSVCIRNRGRGANPNLRNRGRRAKPSFSVLQQSPSVTDTGSWLTWDCLSAYCVVFSGLGKTLAICKDLPGPAPCLWQQSQVVHGGGLWPLAWAAPTLVAPAADSGFFCVSHKSSAARVFPSFQQRPLQLQFGNRFEKTSFSPEVCLSLYASQV